MFKAATNLYIDRDRLESLQNFTGEDFSEMVEKGLDLYQTSIQQHTTTFLNYYVDIRKTAEIMENMELKEEEKIILDSYKRFLTKGARVKIIQDLHLNK